MRFLVAFVAVLGYASASVIAPLAYGLNAGDVQAAVIDANVAAQDQVRAFNEGQARTAEAVIQQNTEAVRTIAENNRNLHETAYWGTVAANQNAIAAAQNQAAAIQNQAAALNVVAARGAYAAPLVGAPYGIATPYINGLVTPYGLGLRAW